MQFNSAQGTSTPENIVDIVVSAFNGQDSIARFKIHNLIDKSLLIANAPLYVDVQPYSLFYRTTIMLASLADREQTKQLFNLSDASIDAIVKRTRLSLESNHEKTWEAYNKIELAANRSGLSLPPLSIKKKTAVEKKPDVRRTYNPTVITMPLPLATPKVQPRTDFAKSSGSAPKPEVQKPRETITPPAKITTVAIKAADHMAKASAQQQNDKPAVQRRKRNELSLGKDVTSLTIPKIVEACMALHDEMGLGLISKEDFTGRNYATPEATRVREFSAYIAYRALPLTNNSLERIASGTSLMGVPIKDSLQKVEKKILAQDRSVTAFLKAAGEKLGLTDHQKTLLFVPHKPRFKSWFELQDLTKANHQPAGQSPVGP